MYSIQSEDDILIKLKIEVNTREHFSVYGIENFAIKLSSEWSVGEARVPTYSLDGLLVTKLIALYQRKKEICLIDDMH